MKSPSLICEHNVSTIYGTNSDVTFQVHKTIWMINWSNSLRNPNFLHLSSKQDLEKMHSMIVPEIFVISKEGRKFSSNDVHARSQIYFMNFSEYYSHLNSQYGWSIDSPSFDVDLLSDSCKIQFLTNERMLIDGNFAHVEFISNLLNQQLPAESASNIAQEMKEMQTMQFILHQLTLNYTELTFKPSNDVIKSLEENFSRNLSYIHHIVNVDGEFINFAGIDTTNEYHLIHPSMFVRLVDGYIQFVDLYAQKIMTQDDFFDFYGDVVGRIILADSH